MKKLLLLNIILFATLTASADVLLTENFDYPQGTLLTENGWYTQWGSATENTVTSGLEFCGYAGSNIGNAAILDAQISNQIHNKFKQVESGSVYAAFMLQPTLIEKEKTWFFSFRADEAYSDNYSDFNFCARVFLNNSMQIGLTFGNNQSAQFASKTLDPSTNYLIVVKYTIKAGDNNDEVSLYLLENMVTNEPSAPTVGPLTDAAKADILPANVVLRSETSDNWIVVDGIRVATTWEEAVASNGESCETAVKQISNNVSIYSTHEKLFITLAANEQVNIFDATGKCVYRENLQAGEHQFNLHKGFYVVKIGTKAQKIIVD